MVKPYTKHELKNSGGYADVYLGINWDGFKAVAIKELRDPSPDNCRRFKRERDMLILHKDNPYVVNLIDSDLEASPPYLVLEYCQFGSLQYYVSNRRSWQRIAKWTIDIAKGLELIHAKGEKHRDIKPSNLLLFKRKNQPERVELTDFGLAINPNTISGPMTCSPYGTKGYIDPFAESTQSFESWSDIYSLGITIRELLTGNKAWNRFTLLPGPVEFRNLVQSMTHPDPLMRPTAQQVHQALEAILNPPMQVPMPVQQQSGMGWLPLILGLGVVVLANSNKWDKKAGRYRNSKGQFKSGWLSL